jgi:hypothetical protein
MKPLRHIRRAGFRGLAIAVLALPIVVGCGDGDGDDGSSATVSSASAGSTPVTEAPADPASNIESLSYLMQGLLTTAQIGGGWVDMGRVVVPPSADPQFGPLCPDGRVLAEPIGATLNAQVHTTYQRFEVTGTVVPTDTSGGATNPALSGGSVMESLLWNERQMVDEAFTAMAAATEACIGEEWPDPDMGEVRMTAFDVPTIGTASFTVGYEPVTPPATDPWAEIQSISVLMSDPSSSVSVVVSVSMTVVHNDPSQMGASMDTDELTRIAEVAVARIMDGL